ncbi:MAG: sigma-54-dependent Fis family transcriptional regulator, partial [Bacteroidales bacterium]|nr:sigma-54-dependent Fis family transcriptional regulator [Bacteroidales bacterium]
IMSEGNTIGISDIELPDEILQTKKQERSGNETLEETEEKAIRAAMAKFGGNLSMVAKVLQISRPTLYSKLKKYNI